MVHGAVHLLFRVLGAVLFLLLMTAGFLAWRLSQGPLPLDLLTPYLEDALASPDDDFRLTIGHTQLTWERGDRELDLRAADVRAVNASGAVLAAVPEIGISLEPLGLLRGELQLSAVEVIGPHIQLRRDVDGGIHFGLWHAGASDVGEGPGADAVIAALLRGLGDEAEGPVAALSAVRIVRADATIVDEILGATWQVPTASIELLRGRAGSIGLAAQLEVGLPNGTTRVDVTGGLHPGTSSLDLQATFKGLRPAAVAGLSSALEPLGAVDLPLDGTVRLGLILAPRLVLDTVSVNLIGGAGIVRLPEPLAAEYAVGGLEFRASASAADNAVLIETLEIALSRPEGIEAPGPSKVRLMGTVGHSTDGGMAGEVAAFVENIPVDALRLWWPQEVGPNPREWVTEHLSDGYVPHGRWAATLGGATLDTIAVTGLSGAARVEGMTVDYLAPMPKATGAAGDMTFALDTITLSIEKGEVSGLGSTPLRVTGGVLAFNGLDTDDSSAVINLVIEGGLYQALRLIDHQPLGYTSTLGLSPKGAKGRVRTDLKLAFPLLANLPLDMLTVETSAVVEDAFLPGAVFNRDLSAGNLTLKVDTNTLEARGQARIGGVPTGFVWREIFSGKPYRSRYVAQALVEEDKRDVFGLDFPPFTAPFLTGPIHADIDLTVTSKTLSMLNARLDLVGAGMDIPGFNWTKAPGVPAHAAVSVRMAGDTVREVPNFMVRSSEGSGGPLVAEGRVALHGNGDLDRIEFTRADLGETSMTGSVMVQPDGTWDVAVKGLAFDATPFLTGGKRGPETPDEDEIALPPLRVNGEFDVVWLAEDGTMEHVRTFFDRKDEQWRSVRVDGLLEGKTPFSYRLTSADPAVQDGNRVFAAATEDAGALLRSLDLLGTMRGGRLDVSGTVNPQGIADGRLLIDSYRLVEAPVLAQLLSVAALTGILDALSGEGIAFQSLEAPFTYGDDVLTLTDFRTSGPSLGLTGDGTVDLGRDEMAINGTLVPAYALNSLLGKIPLVGGLLTGFEKDGGMFAASYSVRGPTSKPDIRVNPLAALAPGFFRKIFGPFDTAPSLPALKAE